VEQEQRIGKISQIIQRKDGSEVKIVVTEMDGLFNSSIDVYVLRRESSEHNWHLTNNRPHPNSKNMSVDEYIKHGRSEMLQAVTPAEILKLTSMIGKPMSCLQ